MINHLFASAYVKRLVKCDKSLSEASIAAAHKNGGSANKGKPKSEEHKLKIAAAIREKHRKKKYDSASMVE